MSISQTTVIVIKKRLNLIQSKVFLIALAIENFLEEQGVTGTFQFHLLGSAKGQVSKEGVSIQRKTLEGNLLLKVFNRGGEDCFVGELVVGDEAIVDHVWDSHTTDMS